jgi:hypothetical protein
MSGWIKRSLTSVQLNYTQARTMILGSDLSMNAFGISGKVLYSIPDSVF